MSEQPPRGVGPSRFAFVGGDARNAEELMESPAWRNIRIRIMYIGMRLVGGKYKECVPLLMSYFNASQAVVEKALRSVSQGLDKSPGQMDPEIISCKTDAVPDERQPESTRL
ncbi:MAG: hypothetical protein KAU50_10095 [Candidatus Marinimicrobia bacterium]|nr:hypothetical protein [Candidatus Neomarinimicrobiota bacterium]